MHELFTSEELQNKAKVDGYKKTEAPFVKKKKTEA